MSNKNSDIIYHIEQAEKSLKLALEKVKFMYPEGAEAAIPVELPLNLLGPSKEYYRDMEMSPDKTGGSDAVN